MSKMSPPATERLGKHDYERLSHFRHRLRHFLRVSELLCKQHGLTPLQYQLLLHVMGFPGRTWATVGELAERLQAHHHGVVALVNRCEALRLLERRPGRILASSGQPRSADSGSWDKPCRSMVPLLSEPGSGAESCIMP